MKRNFSELPPALIRLLPKACNQRVDHRRRKSKQPFRRGGFCLKLINIRVSCPFRIGGFYPCLKPGSQLDRYSNLSFGLLATPALVAFSTELGLLIDYLIDRLSILVE